MWKATCHQKLLSSDICHRMLFQCPQGSIIYYCCSSVMGILFPIPILACTSRYFNTVLLENQQCKAVFLNSVYTKQNGSIEFGKHLILAFVKSCKPYQASFVTLCLFYQPELNSDIKRWVRPTALM